MAKGKPTTEQKGLKMKTTRELPCQCPYCGADAGDNKESLRYTDTLLEIYRRCDHCGKTWREEWEFRVATVAENAEEQRTLEREKAIW